MTIKAKQILSTILAIVNVAGTVGLLATATKDAPKTKEAIDKLKSENPNVDKKTIVKTFCKDMAFPLSLTAITAISGASSTILSRRAEVSLGASVLALEKGYEKYSGKVKEVLGVEKTRDILTSIAKDDLKDVPEDKKDDKRVLYWVEHVGFFKADPELVALSYADINQRIHIDDSVAGTYFFATLKNFLIQADAEILDKNVNLDELDHWGWSADYLMDMFEYYWIHMHWDDVTENGKSFRRIWFEEDPVTGYLNWTEDHDYYDHGNYESRKAEVPFGDGQIETSYSSANGIDAVDPKI